MKNKILILLLLNVFACFSQSEIRKKKLSIGLAVMGQNITENSMEGATVFFNPKPINYDIQFKIGKIFFKEKITAGLALGFSPINFYNRESARNDEDNKEEYYRSTTEMQFGLFAKYKVYDEIFVDTYVGLFGLSPDGGFFPRGDYYNIIKYNFSVGYSLHLWHFLALEPHISIRNSRTIYKGNANVFDDISPLSFGLGLTFKLAGSRP